MRRLSGLVHTTMGARYSTGETGVRRQVQHLSGHLQWAHVLRYRDDSMAPIPRTAVADRPRELRCGARDRAL